MTTIGSNYTQFSGNTLNSPEKKHPVKNTLLGATAGAVGGAIVGYVQKVDDKAAIDQLIILGKGDKAKIFEEFKTTKPRLVEEAVKAAKQWKALKFGAIGAAVIGTVVLAGTLLSGDKKTEEKA